MTQSAAPLLGLADFGSHRIATTESTPMTRRDAIDPFLPRAWRHGLLAWLVACALHASVSAQPASTWTTRIGDVDIALPLPAGFSTLPNDGADLQALAASMAPSTNRVLALLVNQNDFALIAKKQPPKLGRYVLFETFVDLENATVAPASMVLVKDTLRTRFTTMMAQVTPEVRAQLEAAAGRGTARRGATDMALEAGDMAPIEFFEPGSDAITMISLNKVAASNTGTRRDVTLAAAFTTLLVKGKLIYFYVYSEYKSPADLAWVRSATMSWLASLRP